MEESARLLKDGCETETQSSSDVVPQSEQPQQENWPNFADDDIMRQHSDIRLMRYLSFFYKSSVEPMGEESDHVHIIALLDALGVPIRVVYLDRSSCDTGEVAVNHHDFVPASTGDPPKTIDNTPGKPFSSVWRSTICGKLKLADSCTSAYCWILNSLIDSIAEAVMHNENAQDLWKDLQERYGEVDSIFLAHVRAQISTCKQGTSSVTDYYNRLGVLWKEYLSFKSIPTCECATTPRTTSCVTYVAVNQEQNHTIDFITGLNDNFEMTKNQLLLMDPTPDLRSAYKYALKLERQMGKQSLKDSSGVDSVALASSQQPKGKDPRGHPTTPPTLSASLMMIAPYL
ncbi:unnamed protein product [Linum tenue]|uniref:Retrotransposon gag domain-containing protein n=1 Tax=Linum tenue TaxID=586396 RepID=A0AAV0H831_9ROSI|nr:unnamed protein product [Linum tenue]